MFKFHYSDRYCIDAQILYYRAILCAEFLPYQETDFYIAINSDLRFLRTETLYLLREAAEISVFLLFDFYFLVLFLTPLTGWDMEGQWKGWQWDVSRTEKTDVHCLRL